MSKTTHELERAWGIERRGLMDRINELVERAAEAEARVRELEARLEAVRKTTSMFRGALAMSVSILNRASERHGEPILKDAAIELGASANVLLGALDTPAKEDQ